MKIEQIEEYLEKVSEGTDFSFTVEKEKKDIILYMQGNNPCNEDWCTTLTIENPKTKKELIGRLYKEVDECYVAFDLVHNEEYKENALKEFSEKLRALL